MNKSFLKTIAMGALLATPAFAADVVVNLTGSTAFRSSTHSAILANLTAPTYAYTDGTNGLNKSKYTIFKGTVGADNVTVRCYWSGSVTGVVDVGAQVSLNKWLPPTTTTSVAPGTVVSDTTATDGGIPDGAMSDVFQSSANVTASLTDTIVAVIPFKFIANNGAPITNMTPQLFRGVFGTGYTTLAVANGDTSPANADVYVYGTGRDVGSGTRATAMAETGYGIFSPPIQYTVTNTAGVIDNFVATATTDDGYTSGSTMAKALEGTSADPHTIGYFVSYVGVADVQPNNVEMTYNGVAYSAADVYSGKYTFWGYEHLFTPTRVSTATTGDDLVRKTFFASMAATLSSAPGSAGLNPALMTVERAGDGGTVIPK